MLLLLTLAACKHDNGLAKRTDVVGANDWPKAVVTPPTLTFGEMSYLETKQLTFTITNEGTDNSALTVDDIVMTAGDDIGYVMQPPEGLADPQGDLKLLFGESAEVVVTLTSLGPGDVPGTILVKSDDEENPSIPVPMIGLGLMPMLMLTPPSSTYDDTTVGCERTESFQLTNVGNDNLDLTSVESTGPGYAIIERPVLPDVLEPGESSSVTLAFTPTGSGTFPGSIVAMSNDPRGAQTAVVNGIGVVAGTQHVSYTIPFVDKADILIFADQSRSMDDDQVKLAENAAAFAASLTGMEEDVQIMVVTAEDGCSTTGILRPDDVDFVTKFQTSVLDGPENVWSEAGLYVSQLAVEQTDAFMCNADFLRDDALLHIVYISDEADSGPVTWLDVVQNLRSKKGSEHLVMISAIIGPVPSGCSTELNSASPGHGYAEAAVETHGGIVSLCDDWAPELNIIATYDIVRDTFSLVGIPDPSTITVLVDGVRRTTGWYYMTDSNSVTFSADPPRSGQTVDITFEVPIVCG